jgi:hypothetical protein
MIEYRIYPVGADGSLIGPSVRVVAVDDAEALAQARLMVTQETSAEVWSGDRLVGQVPTS